MGTGAITQYVDVAQLVLYAFWLFFFGLIYYLVRENHREGYPMETDSPRQPVITGWPVPEPKTYKLMDGSEVQAPSGWREQRPLNAEPAHGYAGAPLVPTGDPMLAGVGPGAYAERADVPDVDPHGEPLLQPLRRAVAHGVSPHDVDPRGLAVFGADGEAAGTVVDMWVDICEMLFRYIEVELPDGQGRILVPMNFARIKASGVFVHALLARHFAAVPRLRDPDLVTLLEEEKLFGYFGGGLLYATPERAEPLF